jgi:hypothetical protein
MKSRLLRNVDATATCSRIIRRMHYRLLGFTLVALSMPVSSVALADPAGSPSPSAASPSAPQNIPQDSKLGGGSVIYPGPAAVPGGAADSYMIPLRLMLDKHLITQAEYDSAMKDLADTTGVRAGDQVNFVLGKWSTTLYGFAEADYIYDTTGSLIDDSGNSQIARGGTYAGDHPRMQFGVRNSRIGFRMRAPESHSIRASALIETDFFQASAAGSGLTVNPGSTTTSNAYGTEQSFFTNPVLRVRHAYLKLETPVVDFLFGQYWHLFGWQPLYNPATVQIQGIEGEIYSRTPQLRISKTIGAGGPVTLEIAVAAERPPQRDSATPEGTAGLRLTVNRLQGMYTAGQVNTSLAPMSIAVSGDLVHVALPEFLASPKASVPKTGTAFAANIFVPVLPASKTHKGNTLSVVGQAAYGYGISDLFTGLTGGVGFPALANPPAPPAVAPVYAANIDPGIATYDSNGNLHFIQWIAVLAGAQYYVPGLDGKMFVSANYSHLESPNTGDYFPNSKSVRKAQDWWDVTVMGDITDAVRLGVEYANTRDEYLDGNHARNQRGQVSAWYIF